MISLIARIKRWKNIKKKISNKIMILMVCNQRLVEQLGWKHIKALNNRLFYKKSVVIEV